MSIFTFTNQFYNDEKGRTLPKSRLYIYDNNTFNFATIYSDPERTQELDNPVIADGAGRFPQIFLDETLVYRVWLKDRLDVEVTPFVNDYSPCTTVDDFGTAAFIDVGTDPAQIPLNSDLGTAAFDDKTSPSATLWDDGNLEVDNYGLSVAVNGVLGVGVVLDASTVSIYLPTNRKTSATAMSITSTFSVKESDETVLGSGITVSEMSLSSRRSNRITKINISGFAGLVKNTPVELRAESTSSLIEIT